MKMGELAVRTVAQRRMNGKKLIIVIIYDSSKLSRFGEAIKYDQIAIKKRKSRGKGPSAITGSLRPLFVLKILKFEIHHLILINIRIIISPTNKIN